MLVDAAIIVLSVVVSVDVMSVVLITDDPVAIESSMKSRLAMSSSTKAVFR